MTNELCFPFVAFLVLYVVVSPLKVYLREVLQSLELVNKLQDERETVIVLHSVLIEVPIVLYHPFSPIFLRHEEYRQHLFRLGQADVPFGELFIDEFQNFFLLFR